MRLLNHILSPAILFIVLTGCSPAEKEEDKAEPEEFLPLVRYSMLVNEYCAEEYKVANQNENLPLYFSYSSCLNISCLTLFLRFIR